MGGFVFEGCRFEGYSIGLVLWLQTDCTLWGVRFLRSPVYQSGVV